MILVLILLLIATASYREIQILIDRGSWKKEHFWIKFWYIDWQSFWSKLDSFHFMNGLFTLILVEIFVEWNVIPVWFFNDDKIINILIEQAHVACYWYGWMKIRDLFLHIIYRKAK